MDSDDYINDTSDSFVDSDDLISEDDIISEDDVISEDKDIPATNMSNIPQQNKFNNLDFLNGVEEKKLNKKHKLYVSKCAFCELYYSNGKNSTTNMFTKEYSEGENVCYHCFYRIYYNPPDARYNFDGVYGMNIVDFVIKCRDTHNTNECKFNDECFICDHLNGKKIDFILNPEKLIPKEPITKTFYYIEL